MDYFIGVLWIVRMFCQHINRNEHEGNLTIYSHDEVISLIKDFIKKFLEPQDYDLIGKKLYLITVNNGEEIVINNNKIVFFDIYSKKAKQYGFTMEYDTDKHLSCCGDEPYCKINEKYVKNNEWLIHEAFCLKADEHLYKPYEKNHSTVVDACKVGEKLKIKNLLLYHSVDKDLKNRKKLFISEGKEFFSGNLYVLYDLEIISL